MTEQPRKRVTIDAPTEFVILAARHLDATEGPVQVGSVVDTSTRSAITTVLRYITKAHNSPADPEAEQISRLIESCGRNAGVLPHPPHKFMRGRTLLQCPGESSPPLPQEAQGAHGCTIDGQPAMPILVSEHTELVARAAEAEAFARRALAQRQEMAAERYAWQERGDRAEAALAEARQRAADAYGQRDRLRNRIIALADRWQLPGHISMPDAAAEIAEALDREKWAPTPDPITRVRALADRWDNALSVDKTYARALRAALDGPQPTTPTDEQYRFATTWSEYHAGRRAVADRKAATPPAAEVSEACSRCPDSAVYPRRLMDVHIAVEHPDIQAGESGRCRDDDLRALHAAVSRIRNIDRVPPQVDADSDTGRGYAGGWRDALDRVRTELVDLPGAAPAPSAPDAEPATVTNPAWLCQQYAKAIAADDGHPWDTLPADRQESYLDNADAVMRVRDRHIDQLRQRLEFAEHFRQDIAAVRERADRLAADLDEAREEEASARERAAYAADHAITACKNHDQLRKEAEQRADELAAELRALQGAADADSKQLAEVDERCDRYAETLSEVLDVLDRNGGVPPAETDVERWRAVLGEQPDGHVYLSTGCRHGDHDYCKNMTGMNGAKRPGECKHCGAKCWCPCHATPKETR